MIKLTRDPIDTQAAERFLADPHAGGAVTFVGTVRNHHEGRDVLFLEYEAYPEMALAQMEAIHAEIVRRWPADRVVLIHRVGKLEIGEAAVFVGVSCAHRDEAFESCRYGIEQIKSEVPIWKKETYRGGAEWLANC